jgi:Rap1a immunity proteins
MRTLYCFALVIFGTASSAWAGFYSGSYLLDLCNTNSLACMGYVVAIADSSICPKTVNGYSWLPPDGVTTGQVEKVTIKWLNEHPEKLHLNASGLVAFALSEAFPCK